MPTRITQLGEGGEEGIVLRVEGKLICEDAELLERVCADIRREEPTSKFTLDLGDLTYLDSEGASVLCRIKRQQKISLEGLQVFVQRVIDLAEKSEPVTL